MKAGRLYILIATQKWEIEKRKKKKRHTVLFRQAGRLVTWQSKQPYEGEEGLRERMMSTLLKKKA